jgi:hypothetical protein
VRPGFLVALVGALAVLVMVASFNPYLGDFGDDAEFLILGQGLARGQGYAWINSPETPAHNRYPPLYPLLLGVTMVLSGTASDAYRAIGPSKVVTAASLVIVIGLLWPFARRRLPPWWALVAVTLLAFNPVAIRFAVQVMSDVPYVPLLLAALLWAERQRTSKRILSSVALGVLLALGAYARSIGLPAAAGVLAWTWLRPHRRAHAFAASLAFAACLAPWWVRDASLAGGWRYLQELTSASYLDPDAGSVSAADLLARAIDNTSFVVGKPASLGPLGLIAALAGMALLLVGARRSASIGGGAAELAAAAVCLSVLVWPIKTGRYLLPVIPLAGVYALMGLREAQTWFPTRIRTAAAWRPVVPVAVLAPCVLFFALSVRDGLVNLSRLGHGPSPADYFSDRPEWAHYLGAAAWLRDNASPTDVAMARRHFALYVYSGHYADKYRYDTSDEELAYLTAGLARKYVVEDAFDFLRGDFSPLPTALLSRGGALVLRYETSAPSVRVWELVRPR